VCVLKGFNDLPAGSEAFSVTAPAKNRVRYGGVAVVPANYGIGG
jgi:hypothetical protein